ncbi:unnamed protein product [Peniophora sp. CBMAI 1063]|nr:unnamed protein product [Peniophora sp. CBMAI 1063]
MSPLACVADDVGLLFEFIPATYHQPPPTKYVGEEGGRSVYLWYITENEYLRLNTLFQRDFQETGMGGTFVVGLPLPCERCGKYQEFIDWVWTALNRSAHSSDFIFNALAEGRQGRETQHDVYCSQCGMLTSSRSRNNREGGATDIQHAGPLRPSARASVPTIQQTSSLTIPGEKNVTWGRWWLDTQGGCLVSRYGDKVLE